MQNIQNINFVLIGARATGKTVYLASLFLNEKSITSEDKHTMEYLKPLADTLVNGAYPQATSGTLHELMFNYKSENVSCQIQIDDVDGHFIETLHKEDEATQSERDRFIANIKNSEGIIFFFPFEGRFNEESIKSFNYEIDTIISEITKMYRSHDSIPIPAVIAVTKWDRSPDFKAENEDDKALEYINTHEFLKRAKEKIEHYFSNLSIIPISATGKDIELMEPYNLVKPLEFFIDNTYRLWEKKIENLKEKKRELLKFLSRVYFDMKFYKEGKYNRLYDELEKEFADEIRLKAEGREDYLQFSSLEKEYKDVLPYLLQKNRDEIEEIGKKLKSKQTIKKASWGTGIIVAVSLLGFGVAGWYIKTKLLQTESELFSDIEVEYKNNNYKDAYSDILDYQKNYPNTLDIEHKNSIEEMKNNILKRYKEKLEKITELNSLIKQHEGIVRLYNESSEVDIKEIKTKYDEIESLYKEYQDVVSFSKNELSGKSEIGTILNKLSEYNFIEINLLKDRFRERLTAMANNLVSNKELDDVDSINTLLEAFTSLSIDNAEVVQGLMDKRNSIQQNNRYNELKESIKNLEYKEAINVIETDWRNDFSKDKAFVISNILEKKFNEKIEKILKNTSEKVNTEKELKTLGIQIEEIESLKNNTQLPKIEYKPKLTNKNKNILANRNKAFSNYKNALKNGVKPNRVYFSATKKDNSPLGFDCESLDSDDDIVLTIDSTEYNYEDRDATCIGLTMTWRGKQNFTKGNYTIKVKEIDPINNDEYSKSFKLTKNDIISLYNEKNISKKMDDYTIILEKN